MRKSIVSMGLASVLIVPSILSAANPQMVHAKSTSKVVKVQHSETDFVSKKISKKARAVIKKIKAINPKKSNYIAKTKSAKNAYNKLSKKDKKMVTNYSTLKKYWNNIQPSLKKISQLEKSVSTLNNQNYVTKVASVQKNYSSMNAITKAAVPSTTVKKLSFYSNVTSTHKLMLLAVTSPTKTNDGTKIYDFITSYKKLSGAQKALLQNLNDPTDNKKLTDTLALEDTVKVAADVEKKYAALKPTSNTYGKDAVALYNEYNAIDTSKSPNPTEYIPDKTTIFKFGSEIYKSQIEAANTFSANVAKLEDGSITDSATMLNSITNLITNYNSISKQKSAAGYPKLAPIDLVDKTDVATYNKYATIPEVVTSFNSLPSISSIDYAGSGVSNPTLIKPSQISTLINGLALYKKLGSDQKAIVKSNVLTDRQPYLSEDPNVASAQSIDKTYASATKTNTSTNYYSDLKKVIDAYTGATPEVKRFVVNGSAIVAIPTSTAYINATNDAKALTNAINNLNENSTLSGDSGINAVIGKYKIMSNQVPTPLSLVDPTVLKTYSQYVGIPDLVKLIKKVPDKDLKAEVYGLVYGYKTSDINNILSAIKTYKKLGTVQQTIVDKETNTHKPTIEELTNDESNIKAAQAIDHSYANLKKSSTSYPKDAKNVYTTYDDASPDVIKYLVNTTGIVALPNVYKSVQGIATAFEDMVGQLNKKSSVGSVESVVSYYNANVKPNSKVSDLVDGKTMKEYQQYAPISDALQILGLIKVTDPNTISPTNAKYIQNFMKVYNKLGSDQQAIIDDSDRSKFNYLQDADEISQAATIDKAFEQIKPTDQKYELEVIDVYYTLYDRAPDTVKKYVANKEALKAVGERYKDDLIKARTFETMVTNMSDVAARGNTPLVTDVKKLEDYFVDKIKYNTINAKYNIPLTTIIDEDIMKQYENYVKILQIQNIAKSIYVQYGRLFNGTSPLGYTDTGTSDGRPIKITSDKDINNILKAIQLYKELDSTERAIVDKAPRYAADHTYEDRYNIPYTGDHTENEIIRPSIPLNDDEVKYFLAAQEIDKAYEALDPSSDTYAQDAVTLYFKYVNAGKNVQIYVQHSPEIEAFKTTFNADKLKAEVDAFVTAVNKLTKYSDGTMYSNVKNVVDRYNVLNEIELSLLEKPVLTKYNSYAPIVAMKADIASITGTDKNYSSSDIAAMLDAISIYKKLSKDPKSIVDNDTSSDASLKKPFLADESAIKAAQVVDKSYEKLDPTSSTYGVDLKKVKSAYDKLSPSAQKYVINKDITGITSNVTADTFTAAVNGLSPSSTYQNVSNTIDLYNSLSPKEKSYVDSKVLATYNNYAPIVTIVKTLSKVSPLALPSDPNTPPSNTYNQVAIDNISNAITLYNKLGKDQKAIVDNTDPSILTSARKDLLKDGDNIKAAQTLDKKILALKSGTTGFVKGVIEAAKIYDVMGNEQKIYVQNSQTLESSSYIGEKNIKKAITNLSDFETGVLTVEDWSADLTNDPNATCPQSSTTKCNQAIVDKMIALKTLSDQLNTSRLIKGEEITLATLIDRTILAKYQYYYAVYDIKDALDNL